MDDTYLRISLQHQKRKNQETLPTTESSSEKFL